MRWDPMGEEIRRPAMQPGAIDRRLSWRQVFEWPLDPRAVPQFVSHPSMRALRDATLGGQAWPAHGHPPGRRPQADGRTVLALGGNSGTCNDDACVSLVKLDRRGALTSW